MLLCVYEVNTNRKREVRAQMDGQLTSIIKQSKSAAVVSVIIVEAKRGSGTENDPTRLITEVWSMDGTLIAVNDPAIKIPAEVRSYPKNQEVISL